MSEASVRTPAGVPVQAMASIGGVGSPPSRVATAPATPAERGYGSTDREHGVLAWVRMGAWPGETC